MEGWEGNRGWVYSHEAARDLARINFDGRIHIIEDFRLRGLNEYVTELRIFRDVAGFCFAQHPATRTVLVLIRF